MTGKLRQLAPDEVRCRFCGRVGTRGFLNIYGQYDGRGNQGWFCKNHNACERRQLAEAIRIRRKSGIGTWTFNLP